MANPTSMMTAPYPKVRLGGDEGKKGLDTAAADELKKQHRRIQNRKNQRARRQRVGGNVPTESSNTRRPYQVECWRIDELNDELSRQKPTTKPKDPGLASTSREAEADEDCQLVVTVSSTAVPSRRWASFRNNVLACWNSQHKSGAPSFPLSMDHLMSVIQFNVLIGLKSNKYSVPGWRTCNDGRTPRPSATGLPCTIMPTALQMERHHSAWIDMIPFPRVRDNLIRWEGYFDQRAFLRDLIGEIGGPTPPETECSRELPVSTMTLAVAHDSAGGDQPGGLIVWGEPHELSSWELTPEFLAKWMWVAEGCEELLVGMSNRWRLARGDDPMRLSSTIMSRTIPAD